MKKQQEQKKKDKPEKEKELRLKKEFINTTPAGEKKGKTTNIYNITQHNNMIFIKTKYYSSIH